MFDAVGLDDEGLMFYIQMVKGQLHCDNIIFCKKKKKTLQEYYSLL